MVPDVLDVPPPGWPATEIARPRIAETAGAQMTSFRANRSASDDAALVSGCVATPIPGWLEEMRPAVEGRTIALAAAAAERVTGRAVDARADASGALELRAASDLQATPLGVARTFVGFDASRVFTCFVLCATRIPRGSETAEPLGCESSVRQATLEGSVAPPHAGLGLRSVAWAIHHPRPSALVGGGLMLAAGIIAVVTRRRPRCRRAHGNRHVSPEETGET